jgi:hypothetical protein
MNITREFDIKKDTSAVGNRRGRDQHGFMIAVPR